MTASVQPESKSPSRRAVLAAALGGAAAMVARTVVQPSPARAAGDDGLPILVGSTFLDVQTGTYLSDAANDNTVLSAVSSSAGGHGAGTGVLGVSGSGTGVRGSSDNSYGVRGMSGSAIGVSGTSNGASIGPLYGIGVYGTATSGVGVWGNSSSSDLPANFGKAWGNGTGVSGLSGSSALVPSRAKTAVYGLANLDATSKGVLGSSPAGHGVHGESSTGWAGYFDGRVLVKRYAELVEIGTPSAPVSNHAKLFIRDNGSGKTQLCVRFHTGSVKVLATQP